MNLLPANLRFREERKRLGYTLDTFGAALSVSKSTIAYYETGKTEPNRESLEKAESVGADIFYIVTGRRLADEVAQQFDWDLLGEVLQCVERWADKFKLKIASEKKLKLIMLLYKQFSATKTVEDSVVEEMVKLVA